MLVLELILFVFRVVPEMNKNLGVQHPAEVPSTVQISLMDQHQVCGNIWIVLKYIRDDGVCLLLFRCRESCFSFFCG